MSYSPPEHGNSSNRKPQSAGVRSLVQAERLMQIAFVLPCATLIGWAIGWWLGGRLHVPWLGMAGLIFGIIAGMVSAVRMALGAGSSKGKSSGNGGGQ